MVMGKRGAALVVGATCLFHALICHNKSSGFPKRHQIIGDLMVPAEGVEPTHHRWYQILSLARLPIPPRRHTGKSNKPLFFAV
jgi:hypothetical protein